MSCPFLNDDSVGNEPGLQPLSGEFLKYKTANDADDACVDIVA